MALCSPSRTICSYITTQNMDGGQNASIHQKVIFCPHKELESPTFRGNFMSYHLFFYRSDTGSASTHTAQAHLSGFSDKVLCSDRYIDVWLFHLTVCEMQYLIGLRWLELNCFAVISIWNAVSESAWGTLERAPVVAEDTLWSGVDLHVAMRLIR